MKKKILVFLPVLIILLLYILPKGGDVRIARREIGESTHFTTEDIESAMQIAQQHFDRHFEGCTLLTLTYEEVFSDRLASGWAANYDAEEAIVLYSSFWVDKKGGDGSFNPSSLYTKWQWILTRNNGEKWKLQTWGYG